MFSAILNTLGRSDLLALCLFILLWVGFEFINDRTLLKHKSLSGLMAHKRREWMLVMAQRDVRIVDTQVLANLQQGAAFFASTSIFAIGGCFALMGATETVLAIYKDLPVSGISRGTFEIKVLGLATIFVYAFFKFAWSFRLFNYCGILIGAVLQSDEASKEDRRKQALLAADININASRHFTAGLRGIFFALGYLGWFIGPEILIGSTLFVIIVLVRRQYFSSARKILAENQNS